MPIDTNALLSIAFSVISNFTNVVEVPAVGVPTCEEDLTKYVVGSPRSPTDLYLVHRRGAEFWIRSGVVYRFDCPGAFFTLQDPDQIPRFMGEPTISSNQAVQLATEKVTRLLRHGNPLTNALLSVKSAGFLEGKALPFYEVKWSYRDKPHREVARVEVDARKPAIVFMHLWDDAFHDREKEDEIRRKVWQPDAVQAQATPQPPSNAHPPRKSSPLPPTPTTNQVLAAMNNWLWFCQKSGVRPGAQTNLADVNWSKSHVSRESILGKRKPVCIVHFKGGASFTSYDGAVFSASAPGYHDGLGMGIGQTSPSDLFHGKIGVDWQEAVTKMERSLTADLKISPAHLVSLVRTFRSGPPPAGSYDWYPLAVWYSPKPVVKGGFVDEPSPAFYTVFDLRDGSVMCLDLGGDEKIVQTVIRTQERRKR